MSLSLLAPTLASTKMENLTWMSPWMLPDTWRNFYAGPSTASTPASPHLLASSPLPEGPCPERGDTRLLSENYLQCEEPTSVVTVVSLYVYTDSFARVRVCWCHKQWQCTLAHTVLGLWLTQRWPFRSGLTGPLGLSRKSWTYHSRQTYFSCVLYQFNGYLSEIILEKEGRPV